MSDVRRWMPLGTLKSRPIAGRVWISRMTGLSSSSLWSASMWAMGLTLGVDKRRVKIWPARSLGFVDGFLIGGGGCQCLFVGGGSGGEQARRIKLDGTIVCIGLMIRVCEGRRSRKHDIPYTMPVAYWQWATCASRNVNHVSWEVVVREVHDIFRLDIDDEVLVPVLECFAARCAPCCVGPSVSPEVERTAS